MVESIYKYVNEIINEETLLLELERLAKLDKYKNNETLETLIKEIKDVLKNYTGIYPRYEHIYKLVVNNELYLKEAKAMTDEELLDLITTYISVSLPPSISYDYFEKLVSLAIKGDNAKKKCFRLLTNYVGFDRNFSKIIDFFIEERDSWYLSEIICFCGKDIDIMDIVEKVVDTKDKRFIKEFLDRKGLEGLLTDEEIKLLKDAS